MLSCFLLWSQADAWEEYKNRRSICDLALSEALPIFSSQTAQHMWLLCILRSWIDLSFMSLYSLSLNPCKLLILTKSFHNKFHKYTTCFVKNHFLLLILNLRATNFIWCFLFFVLEDTSDTTLSLPCHSSFYDCLQFTPQSCIFQAYESQCN